MIFSASSLFTYPPCFHSSKRVWRRKKSSQLLRRFRRRGY